MYKKPSSTSIAALIWILTSIILGIGFTLYTAFVKSDETFLFGFAIIPIAAVVSLPVLIVLFITIPCK
jgi:hypothetical protein